MEKSISSSPVLFLAIVMLGFVTMMILRVEVVFCVVVLVVDLVVEAIVKQNTLKQMEQFHNATLFVYYPFSLPKEIMKIVVA